MTVLVVCHKDPYSSTPRGGETSVRLIIEFLERKKHKVLYCVGETSVLMLGPTKIRDWGIDLILSWGEPAFAAYRVAKQLNIKFVLMVRFWKNICPLPAGRLLERKVDEGFTSGKRPMFEYASAIITNTNYAVKVIERWQPVSAGKVYCCYVPIEGAYDPVERSEDLRQLTIITPEIYGELALTKYLTEQGQKVMVINADEWNRKHFARYTDQVYGYVPIDFVWPQTEILLVPAYDNDICGTRRVTIEALRRGIPVITMSESGMSEKVSKEFLVGSEYEEWLKRVQNIRNYSGRYAELVKKNFNRYKSGVELKKFESILENLAT